MELDCCLLAYAVIVSAKVLCYVASERGALQVTLWASVVAHRTPVVDPLLSTSRAFVIVDIDGARHYSLPF